MSVSKEPTSKESTFQFKALTGSYPVTVYIYDSIVNGNSGQSANDSAYAHKTTIVLLNALGVLIKKYSKVIEGLTQRGFTVVSADYPCMGNNRPQITKGIDYGYDDLVSSFIPNLMDKAKAHTPDNNIVLMGHSLGGHIGTLYSTIHDVPIIGVASGSVYYKAWDGLERLKIFKAVAAFKSLVTIYGYLPGHLIGFGEREPKTQMLDWCSIALTGKFDFIDQDMSSGKGHGLYINIIGDDFAPLESTAQLANLCHSKKIVSVKLADELKGNQHGVWIKEPADVINIIMENLDFISS